MFLNKPLSSSSTMFGEDCLATLPGDRDAMFMTLYMCDLKANGLTSIYIYIYICVRFIG